jgi:small-conductance mechanosensitive channel
MYNLVKKDSPIVNVYKASWLKVIVRTANVLIVIAIVSVLCNIIGYVNLSIILSNSLVSALIVPVILTLTLQILMSLFISLFKTNLFQYSNIIKSYEEKILKFLRTLLIYFAIFLWIRSILVSLGLAEQVGNWILGLMEEEWQWGSVTVSFGGIIAFFIVIIITAIVTRGIKYLLEDEIFPRIKLGRGVPGAISMVVRYTLVAFGIYVALSAAGVDLGQFGLIAGALGVGIGFGLQGVVYNFIAGLILAFERPIQKGDTIEIGTLFGDVKEIGVRASTIRTYDGSEVIVPNGNLISNELTNWTLSDRVRRRIVKVNVAYGNNPHEILDLLFKVASENENVVPFPKPWPLFEGFGDSSLNFSIRFWVNFDQGMTVQSQVAMAIYDALADAGIQIPFPQQDLHVKSMDPTIQKTIYPFSKEQLKKTTGKKPGRPKKQEDPE